MMFVIGIVLFALCILISVALHECGHMWVARATGMKVRRYFVGFGPTLWSTHRPNRLGSTEYGVKAVPLGGFCDIAGMTSVEELTPEERPPYAMFKQDTWRRVAVLFAGPAMNFIIGLVLIYAIAVVWGGLPNLHQPTNAMVGETACVAPQLSKGKAGDCAGPGPAALAGIKKGDVITKVGDARIKTFDELVAAVRKVNGPTVFTVDRVENGQSREFTTTVDVTATQRWTSKDATAPTTVGAIGVAPEVFAPTQYNPLSAVPATFAFTGDLAVELGKSLAKIPTKVGALVHSIGGGERDPETPDQRGGRQHHRRRHGRSRSVGGVLVLPGATELRARRDQPGAAAAVRRRPHRDRGIREDPQPASVGARQSSRGAGQLPEADARHLRDPRRGGRLHAVDRHR